LFSYCHPFLGEPTVPVAAIPFPRRRTGTLRAAVHTAPRAPGDDGVLAGVAGAGSGATAAAWPVRAETPVF